MQIDRCEKTLEEIEEGLDGAIVGFQGWGWHIKAMEKEDEKAYYAERALAREVGMDTGGLSREMGKDISHLIRIRRNLWDIKGYLSKIRALSIWGP